MSTQFFTLDQIKSHLKVTHALRDDEITDLRESAITWVQEYLNKTVYETQAEYDQAVTDAETSAEEKHSECVDVEMFMLNTTTINMAIALYVEYHYYGVSAIGADKILAAAEELLNPNCFLVAW